MSATPMWLVACRQSREIAESFARTVDEMIANSAHRLATTRASLEDMHRVQGAAAALLELKSMIDKEDKDAAARSSYTDKLRRTA
jgi:Tfp pilus assembly protein PilF